ncbi:MAG: hypothetical protein H8K04_07985 [Nitrospira sp.]
MMPEYHRAVRPFQFVSCMELREVLGKRATDVGRLLELMEEVPSDAIYYHTHSFYLRHAYVQTLYPNDFATWAALYAHDRVLGERLGVLDPFAYLSLEALRQDIVTVLDDHLSSHPTISRAMSAEPFDFIRSHVIEAPLDRHAWTLLEFRHAVHEVEAGALYFHLCEARMRKTPGFDDFSHWLSAEDGLNMPELAAHIQRVVRLGLNLEGMRARIVALCDAELMRTHGGTA